MGRLTHLSLSILTPIFLSPGLALSALAADQNTYRPGQAYLKTAATSHQACAQQCQGDAQCRGWNFVRPNPRTASGICEFNARVAAPVNSAISTSGEVITSIDPLMSRAIPTGARTRRVGTPIVEVRKPATPATRPTQVRRMPVPAPQKSLSPTSYSKPITAAPNARPPRTYGGTPTPMQLPMPTQIKAPVQRPAQQQKLTPQQQYYRQQFLADRQRAEQARAQQQNAMRQQQFQRPQMERPPAPIPQPVGPQHIQQPPQAVQNAPSAAAPMPQQQSLYGSLHDDLTKNLRPVARPQTAPDNLNNPDAPISTSRAVPAKPVETAPLKSPVIPGLAGAEQ